MKALINRITHIFFISNQSKPQPEDNVAFDINAFARLNGPFGIDYSKLRAKGTLQ